MLALCMRPRAACAALLPVPAAQTSCLTSLSLTAAGLWRHPREGRWLLAPIRSAQGASQRLPKQDLDLGHVEIAVKHEGDHKRARLGHVPGIFIPPLAGGCHLAACAALLSVSAAQTKCHSSRCGLAQPVFVILW